MTSPTKRDDTQIRLFEAEARLRELAESIREVFWILDWEHQAILFVSPAYEEVWGRPMEELVGNYATWEESVHPDDRAYAAESLRQIANGEKIEDREYRILLPDGSVRWISDRAFPVYGADGALLHIVGVAEDITRRKEAELRQRQLEDRLGTAKRLEAVGELAGGVAHDFNNILAVIEGCSEMLVTEFPLSSEQRELASDILESAKRAAGLTRQLLAFAGRGVVRKQLLNMHTILANLIKPLQYGADQRVRVELALHAESLFVVADASQIEMAFLQLVTNAREAMPEGGRFLVATRNVTMNQAESEALDPELRPGRYIHIVFSDSGIGMDAEVQGRVFEPFFSTKERAKGPGMGLAMVYGCVKNHGGHIQVESHVGVGTAFHVYLPVSSAAEAASPHPGGCHPRSGKRRVLIVDDEPLVLKQTTRMLSSLGYVTKTCSDGNSAVHYYSLHHDEVDLVLLDMIMPGLDGSATFQQLRDIEPNARILITSGYTRHEAADVLLHNGAASFLAKPFTLTELSAAVSGAIDPYAP